MPSRVFWGRHDPILRAEWADVLGDYFEEVEIGFCEDAGHFVHYEQPDQAAAVIDAFFMRLRGGPDTFGTGTKVLPAGGGGSKVHRALTRSMTDVLPFGFAQSFHPQTSPLTA